MPGGIHIKRVLLLLLGILVPSIVLAAHGYDIIEVRYSQNGLTVVSTPPHADIYIDGVFYGVTPLCITQTIASGRHTVRLSLVGYDDYSTEIILPRDNKVTANLKHIQPRLSVVSLPSNAEVYIGGSRIGTTPILNQPLDPGTYWVLIHRDGYENISLYREVKNTTEFVFVTLKALPIAPPPSPPSTHLTELKIDTTPSDAEVFIDNVSKGKTPLDINIEPGRYQLELRKENYEVWTDTRSLSYPIDTLYITLKAVPPKNIRNPESQLDILSNPTDAMVLLNNSYKGQTPLRITVDSGPYQLELRKDPEYENLNIPILCFIPSLQNRSNIKKIVSRYL